MGVNLPAVSLGAAGEHSAGEEPERVLEEQNWHRLRRLAMEEAP